MTALDFVGTALLLGAFVLLAGCYGMLYTVGQIGQRRIWINAGYLCYFFQVVITLLIVLLAPLGMGWQLLIIISCLACFRIPPLAFSYLERTHR